MVSLNFNPNGLTKYETADINGVCFEMDVFDLISKESIMFNATDIAKPFDKRPNDWLSGKECKSYIKALESATGNSRSELVVTKNKSGSHNGTWLHNDLILPYARWLSPEFAVKLDQYLKSKIRDDVLRYKSRQNARYGYFPLVQALEEHRKSLGKDTKEYHKINEFRMIGKISTGYTPSQYRKKYKVEYFRDHLKPNEIELLEFLQKRNTALIEIGLDYKIRKGMIEQLKENVLKGIVSIKN